MNAVFPKRELGQNTRGWTSGAVAQFCLVILAISLLFFARGEPLFESLSVTFISIVLEAFPFMLIGALISGVIEVFVSKEKIVSFLPKNKLSSVFIAAGLGILLPVCECAIVPVVKRLVRKGIPFSAAVAFLLGGPIVNPVVFASTAVAYGFDWDVPVMRVGFGYVVAVVVGIMMGFLFNRRSALLPIHTKDHLPLYSPNDESNQNEQEKWTKKISQALAHAASDFVDVAGYLVMGAFIAALVQSGIDRNYFMSLGENSFLSVAAMMALAVILNLCSEADAFIAASFRLTVPMSAQMAFMVFGPMLDLKLIFMYLGLFRKLTIVALVCITSVVVYILMLYQTVFLNVLTTLF